MNKSQSIGKLAEALAKAQSEMPAVKMNAQNPFLKNKYADLGAVIEATRPILTKNGLSISQFPTSEYDRIGLTSILMHTSGEWIEDTIYIPLSDSKGLSVAQSAGVIISYLRRYQWQSIIGVYSDEDTDGHTGKTAAERNEKPAPEKKAEQTPEHAEAVKAFVASFNAIPQERKSEAHTIAGSMSKANIEDIRKATAHNLKIMEAK